MKSLTYRSLFISDTHFGLESNNVEKLNNFLTQIKETPEYIYLVGDMIDIWKLRRDWYWDDCYNEIIKKILTFSNCGAKIYYVYGNHDNFLKKFHHDFGSIHFLNKVVHTTLDQKRLIVIHGDQFDTVIKFNEILTKMANVIYNNVSYIAKYLYFPFSKKIKSFMRDIYLHISSFEDIIYRYVKKNEYDGIVCGHIHKPFIKKINDIDYYNCGDFLEGATLIVETMDGDFKLIDLNKNENINS